MFHCYVTGNFKSENFKPLIHVDPVHNHKTCHLKDHVWDMMVEKKNGALRVHVSLKTPHVEPSNAALNLGRTDWIDAGHPGVRSSYTMWANHLWMGCSCTVCGLRNAGFFFKFTAFFGAWIETTTKKKQQQHHIIPKETYKTWRFEGNKLNGRK